MKKNLLLIIIIMLVFPSFVYALKNTVKEECVTTNKKNEIIKYLNKRKNT